MPTPQPQAPGDVRGGYETIEVIDDPGGARAVISRRRGHKTHTVAFFKHYEKDGAAAQTSFFSIKHLDSLERVVVIARKRLAELEAAVATTAPR